MTPEVTEVCPNCMREVTISGWDVRKDGFRAYCPYCGDRLMLCDECFHRHGDFCDDCDYCSKTDTCRFNPGGKNDTRRI